MAGFVLRRKIMLMLSPLLFLVLPSNISAQRSPSTNAQGQKLLPNIPIDFNDDFVLPGNSSSQRHVQAQPTKGSTIISFGTARHFDTSVPNSKSNATDGLLVFRQHMMLQTFRSAEEEWLVRQRKIENMWLNKEGADAKSSIGTAYAHNAPNRGALAMSNNSVLLELATRNYLRQLVGLNDTRPRLKRQDQDHFSAAEYKEAMDRQGEDLSEVDVAPYIADDDFADEFAHHHADDVAPAPMCQLNEEQLPCDAGTQYRTFSGWCNNLHYPTWGKSLSTFDRMLPPAYQDGIAVPRSLSVQGGQLPSPRYISSTVHIDVSHLSPRHTLMMMQYGQFLDHDITHTPVNKGPGNTILNCRDCESYVHTHPECWPIPVPQNDGWYPPMNASSGRPYCIPFTRSLPGQQKLGPREQINQNSAYVDASHIYGETVCKAMSLRAPGGKMNSTFNPAQGGKSLMPQIAHMRECKSPSGNCFQGGDPRASEQPALASMHTVFLRAHNHWVDQLHAINPHWDEDRLYHQGRRIVGAIFQHVTYNEFLPRVLGANMINAYGLVLSPEGRYTGYNPRCSATAFNEFATAAFRFGHSLIRPNIPRMNDRYHGMSPHIPLRDGFFNSDMLYKPLMVDEILRGLLAEPMEQNDPFVTSEIKNHLFEDKSKQFSGMDLIAINNQRGRDHGLAGYNHYRAVCELKRAYTFEDLSGEIPSEALARLKHVYKSVDDIDLFTGSLLERPVTGGIVGPTMACIIGSQFKRLRQCDRFWYESNDYATRFSDHQLGEIRKMTLSKVLCDNFDMYSDIQKAAMDAPHNVLNPRIPCDRLPSLNIEAWREPPPRPHVVAPPQPYAQPYTQPEPYQQPHPQAQTPAEQPYPPQAQVPPHANLPESYPPQAQIPHPQLPESYPPQAQIPHPQLPESYPPQAQIHHPQLPEVYPQVQAQHPQPLEPYPQAQTQHLQTPSEAYPQPQSLVHLEEPDLELTPPYPPTRCNIGGRQLELGASALPSPCVSCICAPEGAKCASLRVLNCAKLLQEAHIEEIRRDSICSRQCGHMLSTPPAYSLATPVSNNLDNPEIYD